MLDQLRSAYRDGQLVLFVGAGVSMGLGLPSWRELIAHMAEELGFDADIYQTYGDQYSLAEYYRIQKKTIGPLRSYMDVAWHSTAVDIGSSDIHRLTLPSDLHHKLRPLAREGVRSLPPSVPEDCGSRRHGTQRRGRCDPDR